VTCATELAFSQAAENNKEAIAAVLKRWLVGKRSVLEVGSGTGQHAVYFAELFPDVTWQSADQLSYHPTINARIQQSGLVNVLPPLALEAETFDWKSVTADLVFTANTAHIMPWEAVVASFKGISAVLNANGVLLWYGPFNFEGTFTSPSNANFDQYLKAQAPHMGIRDCEAMQHIAHQNGLTWVESIAMPANNQILVFNKPL